MRLLIYIVLFLCCLAAAGAVQRKRQRQNEIARLKETFGRASEKKMSAERYGKVPAFFRHHPPVHEIDDITWNDLGLDDLYHRMDSTMSAAGEEYLYALLRSSSGEENIPLSAIRYMEEEEHAQERVQMQLALRKLGHAGQYSLYDYLDLLSEAPKESNLVHLPAFVLPAVSVVLLMFNVQAGIVCLIGSFVLNMLTYYRRKGEIDPYIVSLGYLLRMLQCGDRILALNSAAFQEENSELQSLLPACSSLQKGSWVLLSGTTVSDGNPMDLILDYLRILFHLDLICFNCMLGRAMERREELDRILFLVGRADAAIALASYEKSLPYTCSPQLSGTDSYCVGKDGRERLLVKGLYHPMLKNPVANDLETRQGILLTGSNASGKSTFLKAAAICALLAQTAGFCPAREYRASRFEICSSMAIKDNILKGESYFMAEIRSLKRICDRTRESDLPVLCFVDEILRGTNTVERIAASAEILKSISKSGALCFAATHDIELTMLLADEYDNYHFEEDLSADDVSFSYLLKKGPASTRNAIRLLGIVGYDKAVTDAAARRAEEFEDLGSWK